jgi:hypothetical protein
MQDLVGFHHGGAKTTGRKLWYYPAQQVSEHALKHGVEIDLDDLSDAGRKQRRKTSICERRGVLGLEVCIPR